MNFLPFSPIIVDERPYRKLLSKKKKQILFFDIFYRPKNVKPRTSMKCKYIEQIK